MVNTTKPEDIEEVPEQEFDKPDEHSGLLLESFFKISDPETGEIVRQGRA